MAILVDKDTKVIVQGITGRQGSFHTKLMLEYGTKIVAGVTPGKHGQEVCGVPVYDTVKEALEEHEADTSIIFVPAPFAYDAMAEAIQAGIKLLVVITEHIPVHDTVKAIRLAEAYGCKIIGPNTPGIITPGECKVGIMPGHIFKKGVVGIVSRSGTLTYEIASSITRGEFGQSTCIGIGGDPIVGLSFVDIITMFNEDSDTKAITLIGEIGGRMEEEAAEYIKREVDKPVIAFIAGRSAPPGKRMGHAGAIIERGMGTAESKIKALREAGVFIIDKPSQIRNVLEEIL
ncbi:MAG TPA: succinate--CoA ligase subunit alpha [Candidatus Bathyarchaeota archaeon]|nr:succinate--CoA ligase subunit alpha [Candidatus Bathyarchaeota archaeon]